MKKEQEEDQEEDGAISNNGKGNVVQGSKGQATTEKPSGGVLPAVEGHTLGTRYKLKLFRCIQHAVCQIF